MTGILCHRWWLSWLFCIILNKNFFIPQENLQHEDSQRVFGHIRAHNNHSFLPECANITKINPSVAFTFHKNARYFVALDILKHIINKHMLENKAKLFILLFFYLCFVNNHSVIYVKYYLTTLASTCKCHVFKTGGERSLISMGGWPPSRSGERF